MNYRAFGTKATRTGNGDYEFALTSEAPVERVFGIEILEHSEQAINFERLGDGRHPLLVNHESGSQVGVVQRAWFDASSKNVRVSTRFSKSQRAQEIKQDVEDDIRTLVSAGYMIDEVVEEREEDDGTKSVRTIDGETFEREMRAKHGEHFYRSVDPSTRSKNSKPYTYTVTRWTPFEASIVEVPADITVGKGRAIQPAAATSPTKEAGMEKEKDASAGATAVIEDDPNKALNQVRVEGQKRNAEEMERARIAAINNYCDMPGNNFTDEQRRFWISTGMSLEEVSKDMLLVLKKRSEANPKPVSELGLTAKETKNYSLMRMFRAVVDSSQGNTRAWDNAGFELDCHKAMSAKMNRPVDARRILVPFEVLERKLDIRDYLNAGISKRDLTVATAGAGGYLVSTDNIGFIDLYRNRSVALRMGATRLSGLVGNVTIPRQSAAETAVWLANEASTITESALTLQQVALSPKNVGAYTEISHQLMQQSSPSAEALATNSLALTLATAIDLAILAGTASGGQPQGIIGTSGVGSVSGTSLAAAGILEFQSDVAAANVTPGRPGYVTTPAVAADMMITPELPSSGTTRLWQGNLWDGTMFGIPAMSSAQMSAATMLFGDWSEAILAEWGVLELAVNPFAGFTAGIVGVRAWYTMDVGVRHPAAFSYASSIT